MGIDRATVLRRLNALESSLGARLFDRRSDGCILTDVGLKVIGSVQGIEMAAAAIRARTRGETGQAAGVVSVAMPEFLAATLLAPALGDLAATCPGVEIDLRTGHRFVNLARGEADIALRNRRPDHHSLVARRLGTVAIGLFASDGYLAQRPVWRGRLDGHRLILLDEVLKSMPGVAELETRVAGATILMRSSDLPAIMTATQAGAGIGCFPAILACDRPDLRPVAPIVGLPEVYMVTHRDLRMHRPVRAVAEFLARRWRRLAPEFSGRAIAAAFGEGRDAWLSPADLPQAPPEARPRPSPEQR